MSRSPRASRSLLAAGRWLEARSRCASRTCFCNARDRLPGAGVHQRVFALPVDFPADRNHSRTGRNVPARADGTWHLAKLLLLDFFLLSEAVGFARHGIEAAVGVLLLRAAEKILRFAEAVGGAARFGSPAGLRAAHVVIGLLQAIRACATRGSAELADSDCPPEPCCPDCPD